MKVAVTGASGFIGNRAVEEFFLRGTHDVVPVVHSYSSLTLPGRFGMPWRVADHFDVDALAEAFAGCECVLHAAFGSPLTPMSRAVYRAADRAGVRRLVVLSSASVYNQNVVPGTTEASPLPERPTTAYNAAKIVADDAVRSLRAKGRTEVVFLMPSVVFGPRSQWVSVVADQFLRGTGYLINEGRGVCNTVYVDNLVEAARLAMHAPGVDGEAFFVADAEVVTWAEFYRPILAAFGASPDDVHALRDPVLPGESKRALMRERLQQLVESKSVQRIKPHVPTHLVAAYKALVVRPLTERRAAPNLWQPPAARRPDVVLDMGHLQLNAYKLPNDKAARLLGYTPPVSFAEGMRRSVGWLGFAGYPVVDGPPAGPEAGEPRAAGAAAHA
jgi:nucleoside-diphosphate-sugar epimerase